MPYISLTKEEVAEIESKASPPPKNRTNQAYPMDNLQVGEGFKIAHYYRGIRSNVHRRARKLGITVQTQKTEDGGLAVWRIE